MSSCPGDLSSENGCLRIVLREKKNAPFFVFVLLVLWFCSHLGGGALDVDALAAVLLVPELAQPLVALLLPFPVLVLHPCLQNS